MYTQKYGWRPRFGGLSHAETRYTTKMAAFNRRTGHQKEDFKKTRQMKKERKRGLRKMFAWFRVLGKHNGRRYLVLQRLAAASTLTRLSGVSLADTTRFLVVCTFDFLCPIVLLQPC